jgi:hypothetical protein
MVQYFPLSEWADLSRTPQNPFSFVLSVFSEHFCQNTRMMIYQNRQRSIVHTFTVLTMASKPEDEHPVDMRSIVRDAVLTSINTATQNGSGWLVSIVHLE